jgi:hypothetical protein
MVMTGNQIRANPDGSVVNKIYRSITAFFGFACDEWRARVFKERPQYESFKLSKNQ